MTAGPVRAARRAVRRAASSWRALLVATVLGAGAAAVGAQPPGAGRRPGPPNGEQLAELVQRRLGLTDDQARQLRQAAGRFAPQRERLVRDERAARRELRAQVRAGGAADQRAVARLLDTLLVLQRRRVDLVADEQRELARFLTPVQRAEFLALQERAFRAAQQARLRRELREHGGGRGGGRGGGPPHGGRSSPDGRRLR